MNDPDNPPLTGKEVWRRWGDRVAAVLKAHDAKVAVRKAIVTTDAIGMAPELPPHGDSST